jgi:hypothetical protein
MWLTIKPELQAGQRLLVKVEPEKRNTDQNAKLHAMLTEIAGQVPWAGKKRDVEAWKRLMTAAWCRARGEPIELLPAIDGQGVDIVFRRTSDLDKAECAELIEFVTAWCAQNEVELSQ